MRVSGPCPCARWRLAFVLGFVFRPSVPFTGLALDYVRSHKERQRLGLALQHSTKRLDDAHLTERRLQELFDDAPMMYVVVSVVDGSAVVTDCNKLFLSSLGYQREEIIGKRLAEFYDRSSRDALAARLQADAFTPGEGSFQVEERGLLCRDGRILRAWVWLVPIVDDDGTPTGARLVYTDMTQQVRLDEALAGRQYRSQARVQRAPHRLQTPAGQGRPRPSAPCR